MERSSPSIADSNERGIYLNWDNYSWFEILEMGLFAIAIGFICVAFPIILFIRIWSLPIYVIISYFVWIASMLGWISRWIRLGRKKKISEFILPIVVMVFVFTCIYASGYSEEPYEGGWGLIWISPALSTPAFCYIGFKIAEYRQERQFEQLKEWITSLNAYYKKEIEGINKIITLIHVAYSDGNQMEKVLGLLDKCTGSDLLLLYTEKSAEKNMDLIIKIREIATEYAFSNEIENQPIGEISKKMCKLKAECKDRIRSEKEININMYSEIKKEYKERVWKKGNCF